MKSANSSIQRLVQTFLWLTDEWANSKLNRLTPRIFQCQTFVCFPKGCKTKMILHTSNLNAHAIVRESNNDVQKCSNDFYVSSRETSTIDA